MTNNILMQLFNSWLLSELKRLGNLEFFEINLAFEEELSYLDNAERRRLGQVVSKRVNSGQLPLIKQGKTVTNHMLYRIK